MDGFNPLDLLASAAELQQKHEDGPERIIITRQRRNNVAKNPVMTGEQKENRETSNNNNNNNISKNKPSVVIVKKIKKVDLNPELEKMLDEHNYGNAKRNCIKIEKGSVDTSLEINGRKKKRIELEFGNCNNSEQFVQTATTEGQNADKITVVSNTSIQPNESECIQVECRVDCTDKGVCSNRICDCEEQNETAENYGCRKCNQGNNSDHPAQRMVDFNSSQQSTHNTVIHDNDNTCRTPDTKIMKHDSKQEAKSRDVSVDNSELCTVNNTEDGLKLDEQTGEFITKTGEKISIKDSVNEKGDNLDSKILDTKDNEHLVPKLTNANDVCTEMGSVKTVTILNKTLIKSTSEPVKMPYVKVIQSDATAEPGVDKMPQTLVINITRGRNSSDKLTAASNMLNSQDTTGLESKSSDTGIIRSLLAKNKLSEVTQGDSDMPRLKPVVLSLKSPKSQFELSQCSTKKFEERSTSYDSFKELEMTDSVCTDVSASSVHLLSPDCRNPDSMGIVESPVTHNVSELSYSGDNVLDSSYCTAQDEFAGGQDNYETEAVDASGSYSDKTEGVQFSVVQSSPLHSNISNSAVDPDTPGVETISDARELSGDCKLLLTERTEHCDNSANDMLHDNSSEKTLSAFTFDSDHCYAGMPSKIDTTRVSVENESSIISEEGCEPPTPLGSTGELSQDSGYEDVTQSPDVEKANLPSFEENVENSSSVKNLVPVLVSVNSNGCLTVHDTSLTKTLGGQVFLPENMKVLTGTNFTPISQAPLILSPVTVAKSTSVGKSTSVLNEVPKLAPAKPESIIGLLGPKTPEINAVTNNSQEVSPQKYGKFRIGTFASFSNTGVEFDSPKLSLNSPVKVQTEEKPKRISPASTQSRSSSSKNGKMSPVIDTLGTLVQKVKSSLSPVSHTEMNGLDHIQHDHDYCTKNLMPSVVSSFLEARLLTKDTAKGKVTHTKGKKSDYEYKLESKSGKRKRNAASLSKDEIHDDFDIDSENDTHSIPEPLRPKYRTEKLEPKRKDPKVKITGSSNFQDQFVYFMNTKKRSRRRESKDTPLPFGSDRVFIPPKPGDIVVPHLTDQDIENLRLRSKQTKNSQGNMCSNSLRNEFMAAKLGNGTFSATQPAETVVDDEKNIINTILSLENEDLSSPVQSEPSYNESMEMYGQGLNSDIMNLLPEQMNLTPEQMDLLYSAVDEVQNSSPGLVGSEKLVSTCNDPAFQFPITTFEDTDGMKTATPSTEVSDTTTTDQNTKEGETSPESQNPKTTIEETENSCDRSKHAAEGKGVVETTVGQTENISEDIVSDKFAVESKDSQNVEELQDSDVVNVAKDETEKQQLSTDSDGDKSDRTEADKSESIVSTKVTEVSESVVKSVVNEDVKEVGPVTTDSSVNSVIPPLVDSKERVEKSNGIIQGMATPLTVPFSNSGTSSIPTPNLTLTSPVVDGTKTVNTDEPTGESLEPKLLFQSPSSGSVATSFESVINSVSSSSIASEISLPQIDKSLDLLGNDFRLDKGDLFSDTSVNENTGQSSVVQPSVTQVDYNAPWIVTVSMYWNDLPAIMINNQPFVRLVDIHKQILPAKDTGILKKRCQLMGIEVENCSEMQRYFLVQYGRAFNSKSTLIISKENAKVLIGYYVEPQPKTARPEDHHKSIIDHRREQLRRIALARRAAVRAQRTSEKKDEPDPREIKDVETEQSTPNGAPDVAKSGEVSKIPNPTLNPLVQTDGSRLQRATRHKKINFLEMLRGDPSRNTGAEDAGNDDGDKKHSNKVNTSTSTDKKRKRVSKESKVKIVKYMIETDSSEETESVDSDSSSESYDSESTSGSEIHVLNKPAKQRKISPSLMAKVKSRMKTVPKTYNKGNLKVKIGLKKSRPNATSTPVTVQVNKPITSKVIVNQTKISTPKTKKDSLPLGIASPLIFGSSAVAANGSHSSEKQGDGTNETVKARSDNVVDLKNKNGIELSTNQNIKKLDSVITGSIEMKISPTLPENILDTGDEPELKSEELVEVKSTESVNVQTDSCNVEYEAKNSLNSNRTIHEKSDQVKNKEVVVTEYKNENLVNNEDKIDKREVKMSANKSRSQSLVVSDGTLSLMKRKEIVQVSSDETPIRIVHRDTSPQSHPRTRSQLGEVFVDHYHNKKSPCVRCYTCRKMLSVDNFLRHLHDISGALMPISVPRSIDLSESDMSDNERKHWESFLRKKELFDNNQLPSPDIVGDSLVYSVDSENCPASLLETESVGNTTAQSGPRIINTPVSPVKRGKIVRKNKTVTVTPQFVSNQLPSHKQVHRKPSLVVESTEGVRTSSRKRKVKHLYGFEDNSFTKFPRLMKNAVVNEENSTE